MIGECFSTLSNSSFVLRLKVSGSKICALDWEYPNKLSANFDVFCSKLISPNLSLLLIFNPLTLGCNLPFLPEDTTSTLVVRVSYPIPAFITIASVIWPFVITGLTIAPVPSPVDITLTSGNELYSDPWFATITSTILPLTTIGLNSAFLPFNISIFGFIWWFNIVEP